jgi:hypothetical protein
MRATGFPGILNREPYASEEQPDADTWNEFVKK